MIKLLSYHNWMVTSIAVILMSMLQGCAIIIPTPVRPEVQRIDDVVLNEDIYVTIGPRTLLKNVSDQIEKDRQNIIVEDPLLFRDTAFPEGGWLLKEFLDSQRCGEVVSQLGVEYLVLVGSRTTEEGEFTFQGEEAHGESPGMRALLALVIVLAAVSALFHWISVNQ